MEIMGFNGLNGILIYFNDILMGFNGIFMGCSMCFVLLFSRGPVDRKIGLSWGTEVFPHRILTWRGLTRNYGFVFIAIA